MKIGSFGRLRVSPKGIILLDQIIVSGSNFATNVLLARALGPKLYGQFSALILVQFFLLSFQQASVTGIYQVLWPNLNKDRQETYTQGLFYFILFGIVCLTALSVCLSKLTADHIGWGDPGLLIASCLSTGLFLLQDFLRRIFLTQQRVKLALLLDSLTNGVQLLLFSGHWFLDIMTLKASVLIMGLGHLSSVCLGAFWLNLGRVRWINLAMVWRFHRSRSGWLILSALTQWLAGNFQTVVGGWWLGSTALGVLRFSQYIFGLFNVLLQALESYVTPTAARLAQQPIELIIYLRSVLLKSLLVFLPLLGLVSLATDPLVRLIGKGVFQHYEPIMYGLSASYLIIFCLYPLRILLKVLQLNQAYFQGYALAAVFSISTAGWLITHFELKGVLTSLLLTQILLVSYWFIILQNKGIFLWKLFILSSGKQTRPE